jgi:D-3-phosphoglycerate dehydrogenase
MFKIQTLNKISTVGLDLLSRDNYEVASEMSAPDGIILRSYKMHGMDLPESVKAIGRAGAGTNNIPVEEYAAKGVVVFNTPGANANGVKELTITGMLISSRKIVEGVIWAKTLADKGDEVPKLIEGGKGNFAGPEIMGKKLGIIGLGAIGVMVANAAVELGMEVIGYDPFLSVEAALSLSRKVKRVDALESLFKAADFLTVHVPLNDHTKGLVNADRLAMSKDGLRVLNLSRGGLVNNKDIVEALNSGKVATYVTDFPDVEMISHPGVIAFPHLGASTPEAEDNCAIMASNQLKDFLENGNIINSVNFPALVLNRAIGTNRITVAHKNVPTMVQQITTALADASINIAEMANKNRGNVAYTLIDTDSDVSDAVVAAINAIEDVIVVRSL